MDHHGIQYYATGFVIVLTTRSSESYSLKTESSKRRKQFGLAVDLQAINSERKEVCLTCTP